MAYRNVGHLRSHLSVFEPTYPIQKGYIARLLLDQTEQEVRKAVKDIVEKAEPDKILNLGSMKTNVSRFKKLLKYKKNTLTRDWQLIIRMFLEYFPITFRTFPSEPAPSAHVMPITPSSSLLASNVPELKCRLVSETPYQTDTPHIAIQEQTLINNAASGSAPCELSPRKLKGDCASCGNKQRTIRLMAEENNKLQKKLRDLRKTVRASYCTPKRLSERMKRKDHSIRIWKCKYTVVKKECKNTEKLKVSVNILQKKMEILRRHVDELQEERKKLNVIIEQQNRTLKKLAEDNATWKVKYEKLQNESKSVKKEMLLTVKDLKNTAAQLQNEVEMLQEKCDEGKLVITKTGKIYDGTFRLCVYECLLNNVSVGNVCHLIHYISNTLFKKVFSNLPCVATVSQMAFEVGILSNIQVGYILHNCDCATLAWDSTTKEGAHINEVHVSVLTKGFHQDLTLNISVIAGASTDEIYNHIFEALSDVVNTYSEAFGLSSIEMKSTILRKIRSTMSDRARVNHCVHEKLKEEIGELLELKCCLHPLDGLADAARKTLLKLDEEDGRNKENVKPSLKCRVAQMMYNISKLRYKDTGDPAALISFFKERQIKSSVVVRYVGNRLHVLFQMAFSIYQHRGILMEFMRTRQHLKICKVITEHLSDPSIIQQLQVLAIYSVRLTGPWMKLFYEAGLQRNHLCASTDFKTCIYNLEEVLKRPQKIVSMATDFFGMQVNDISTLQMDIVDRNGFFKIVKRLASEFLVVLRRQLAPHLEGPLAKPSAEMSAQAVSAPMHNMHAERTLGMMDALWRRAPNATMGFLDSKVKAVQNRTMHWLESLEDNTKNSLIGFAVRHGVKARQIFVERQKSVQTAVSEKFDASKRKIYEQDVKRFFLTADSEATLLDICESLLNKDMFSNVDVATKCKLLSFMQENTALPEDLMRHVWREKDGNVIYVEKLRHVHLEKENLWKTVVELWFWKPEEFPSDAYFSYELIKFLVDFAMGDVQFLSQ